MSDERESLMRETHRLNHEIGYAGFREQYFDDPDAVVKWPDPGVRERELRGHWEKLAQEHYASYREHFAEVSTEKLAAYRDELAARLAGQTPGHVDYYNQAIEKGRLAGSPERGKGRTR